ncbi:MAG: pyridoxamine 5'-phosphate oxidase family protein [Candidatus Methanomethylophilaceae archaeon]|nr:pyridoxamine 5'-phosphate oxidase family protein [Candidatus Methanomethylophilaceae archaeon]
MSKFDTLCQKLETMDREQFAQLFNQKSVDVVKKLSTLTLDGKDGVAAYMEFVLAAAAADGNLAKDEFKLLKPMFEHIAGKPVTYNDAVKMFNSMGLNRPDKLKNVVDTMVDIIGVVDDEIKEDIVVLCLLVCSIDRDVSEKEKQWIKQLIEPLKLEITPMQYIDGFLENAGSFTLATTCGDQPRMRVLGLKIPLDGKIYFAVGTFKDVYKQLQANPKCEILASIGADFIRWDGKATFSDDPRLMQFVEKAMPDLAAMYKQMGWSLGFFTLEGGSAEYCNVSNEKVKIF